MTSLCIVYIVNRPPGRERSDANVHALMKLNVFAVMFPLESGKLLKDIALYFSSCLK